MPPYKGLVCLHTLHEMTTADRHTPRTKGLLLGLGRPDLGAEQLLQVAALLEEQDDLLEVAEDQPLRQDGAEIANRLVGKSRGRDQEPAEIGAAVERDQVGGELPEVERPVRPPKFHEEQRFLEIDEDGGVTLAARPVPAWSATS